MSNYSVSEVIDSLKVNKFTWRIFFFLALAMVFDGYSYMIASYTMPQISAEWGLNKIQTGSLASWSMIGLIIGGVFAGVISDKIGRKKTLIYAIAVYSLFNVPIFFAQNFGQFALFRVLTGVGLGACIPVVTTIFSESTPTNRRSFFITAGMAWMIVGWVLTGLVATVVVPALGWRYCYLLGALPALYAIFLYFKMNESAYWYANKGRREDAIKSLEYIEQYATGKYMQRNPDDLVVPPAPKVAGPKALFSKGYRSVTAAIWITYFCSCFIIFGINSWLPSLMLEKGLKLSSAYLLSIAQNAAAVIANFTTGLVSEIIGRKKNLIIGYIVSAGAIIIAAFVGNQVIAILAANIFLGFTINYAVTAVQPLMAEGYPTEFRNTGVAWSQAFGRIGSATSPIFAGAVMGLGLGYSMSFLFYIIPTALALLAVILFVRETKGKSLDQLAQEKA